MGGVFEADPDAEGLIAAQVGEQGAVLFIRVVAERSTETAAEQGQATEQFVAVEGVHFGVAVMNDAYFIAEGLVKGVFKPCVGIDFEIFPGLIPMLGDHCPT